LKDFSDEAYRDYSWLRTAFLTLAAISSGLHFVETSDIVSLS